MKNVFEASKVAEQFVRETSPENLVHSRGVVITDGTTCLSCKSLDAARQLVGADGWVFSYIQSNGVINLTCENL